MGDCEVEDPVAVVVLGAHAPFRLRDAGGLSAAIGVHGSATLAISLGPRASLPSGPHPSEPAQELDLDGRTTGGTSSTGFTARERAAMKERAAELEAEASGGRGSKKATAELDVLAKIDDMADDDRVVAERIHADSGLWPTSYAVTHLSEEAEKAITTLVQRASR